jgi:hypothetical protein
LSEFWFLAHDTQFVVIKVAQITAIQISMIFWSQPWSTLASSAQFSGCCVRRIYARAAWCAQPYINTIPGSGFLTINRHAKPKTLLPSRFGVWGFSRIVEAYECVTRLITMVVHNINVTKHCRIKFMRLLQVIRCNYHVTKHIAPQAPAVCCKYGFGLARGQH